MENEQLEDVIDKKIKPLLEDAMHKFLGVTINELEVDISDKIKKSSLFEFEINTTIPFKKAKKMFKRHYIMRLLETNPTTVTELADLAGLKRESFHRLTKELDINLDKFRKIVSYSKETEVEDILKKSLDLFKESLSEKKFKTIYENVHEISRDLIKELPKVKVTLKEAEHKFEKRYLKKALLENKENISRTAKVIGLRFETLHRKLKSFDLI